jgi:hypothetical protein
MQAPMQVTETDDGKGKCSTMDEFDQFVVYNDMKKKAKVMNIIKYNEEHKPKKILL